MDRILRSILAETPAGRAYLESLKAEKVAKRRRVAPKRAARIETKRATREERNERTSGIRAACVKRAAGNCELCGAIDDPRSPLEMHHLLPGRGRRTQEQSVSNCIMVCGMCHSVGHGRILYVGGSLLAWARKHGYRETEATIRRRIDKALIADPSWPRDEDETRRLGPSKQAVTP